MLISTESMRTKSEDWRLKIAHLKLERDADRENGQVDGRGR